MKSVVVIGSGAGGATIAKELQGTYQVTVLEAGSAFRPFPLSLKMADTIKKTGVLFDERFIQLFYPTMKIRKTRENLVVVNGIGWGGTTTIAAGNGIRMDRDLQRMGIDLDREFDELNREVPITTDHQKTWRPVTHRLFEICQAMNLQPQPTPKMGEYQRCRSCGRCILGCPSQVKWDSRQFLTLSIQKGARLISRCRAEHIDIDNHSVTGVWARKNGRLHFYPADLVILAAGGLGTPLLLKRSDIVILPKLFVDPVLTVATTWNHAFQNRELSMPFVVQRENYILSPYFDYLSYFFNRQWKYPAENILGIMIKLADQNLGTLSSHHIDKPLTFQDRLNLDKGIKICKEIFGQLHIPPDKIFLGTINAGHPGGMFPLTENESETLHRSDLPTNLYIADASLFPSSLGNPPILTIMALAKRIARICKSQA